MRIYGPVPSRRFGLSLGVDIIPHKTCPLDCIYCQLGPTDNRTVRRRDFYPAGEIVKDVKEALEKGSKPDVITMAGSGEPGLYASLDTLIDKLKGITDIDILLITNGVLLTDKSFAAAALRADVFAPSLDAGDEETFRRINRPAPEISFYDVVESLRDVCSRHPKTVALEIMLVKGINDSEKSIRDIHQIVKDMHVDRIDLNTPVRPPLPEKGAMPCDEDTLRLAQSILGSAAKPVGNFKRRDFSPKKHSAHTDRDKEIWETLLRRPCTLDDLQNSLGIERKSTEDSLLRLMENRVVKKDLQEERIYYRAVAPKTTIRDISKT